MPVPLGSESDSSECADVGIVLFDLDGTLIDTIPLIVECWARTSTHLGIPLGERSSVVARIGKPLKQQV